jgi:hypothetical protein
MQPAQNAHQDSILAQPKINASSSVIPHVNHVWLAHLVHALPVMQDLLSMLENVWLIYHVIRHRLVLLVRIYMLLITGIVMRALFGTLTAQVVSLLP